MPCIERNLSHRARGACAARGAREWWSAVTLAPPRYLPITRTPLKMVAGLHRLGTDFGHGEHDARIFQLDAEYAEYVEAKRKAPPERHQVGANDAQAHAAREAALHYMRETLVREAPEKLREADHEQGARDPFDALARVVQEDFAVLEGDGDGRIVLVDIRFPSGFRPERLIDRGFREIHAPVPGFADDPRVAASMARTMVERGPFVRFVWTLRPDRALDQHPDAPGKASWDAVRDPVLRVERQLTVPLTGVRASLFFIRVYRYRIATLSAEERALVLDAVRLMPPDIRAYKGLPEAPALTAIFDAT
jgi:dimethylamine monooxygenase subunit A